MVKERSREPKLMDDNLFCVRSLSSWARPPWTQDVRLICERLRRFCRPPLSAHYHQRRRCDLIMRFRGLFMESAKNASQWSFAAAGEARDSRKTGRRASRIPTVYCYGILAIIILYPAGRRLVGNAELEGSMVNFNHFNVHPSLAITHQYCKRRIKITQRMSFQYFD